MIFGLSLITAVFADEQVPAFSIGGDLRFVFCPWCQQQPTEFFHVAVLTPNGKLMWSGQRTGCFGAL